MTKTETFIGKSQDRVIYYRSLMSQPLPLVVYGPVTPLSPAVHVTSAQPGAAVTVLSNGSVVGNATAGNTGELWVPLTSQPTVGQNITALQKTPDGTSDPSPVGIPVIDVPDPLPVPVILSDLNTCMVDILVTALVPGARVFTTIGGAPFGMIVPSQPTQYLGIDASMSIGFMALAGVHQEATIGSVLRVGKTVQSLPIPAFSSPTDLLPPPVLGPLIECDTSRSFLQVTPGAGLSLLNEGQSEFWTNKTIAYKGYGAPPLIKGTAVATQGMPRCRLSGAAATLPVGPAGPPLAPTVSQEICPQVLRLQISNLQPGATLYVSRRVTSSSLGITESIIGTLRVTYPTQPVDLSPSVALTDPNGQVSIILYQLNCVGATWSPETEVKVTAVSGPFGPPSIVEPLFDCGRSVPVTGAHGGALVQAIDAKTGIALSDPYPVAQSDFAIPLWFPLISGQNVLVRQHGCDADGDSQTAIVNPLPLPLPIPKIVEPVRPHAPWVKVVGVVPGARLHLLVNNQVRPGAVDVLATEGIIPVNGAPLAENDRVFVVQTLCDQLSMIDGQGVTVTRGHLKVSVSPPSVNRGTTASVTVTAVDADTGTPVSAQVRLNGTFVGMTGVAFSYSPKVGDPNPMGVVQEPIAYVDAPFSITLKDATWTLFLHAAPVPFYADTLRIDVDEITWTVTPDDYSAPAKVVTVKVPSAPAANDSLILPIPTGGVKTVTVTISGNASTKGGTVSGYSVSSQPLSISSDTKTVAFHGPNELISWLLSGNYDDSSNTLTATATYVVIMDV